MDKLKNKVLLILSYWGYPFGGGEDYLYQSGIWAISLGMECYWINFSKADNKNYNKLSIYDDNGIVMINVPNGFSDITLFNWIKLINPDIVHHQGHMRKDFYNIVSMFRIPFLTGIHFWNGVIQLDQQFKNIDILNNYKHHKIDQDFIDLYNSKYCTFYSVSYFVTEVIEKITGFKIPNLAFSGSTHDKYLVENNDPLNNKYITVINIHKLKGGELILYLLKTIKNIPFIVIKTEHMSEDLDSQINDTINDNNKKYNTQSIFLQRINDLTEIYSQTRILLAPSIVDETFCRVVNEAMMNNIPVITSGCGNLKYLVENAGFQIPVNNYDDWVDTIQKLYTDKTLLSHIIEKTKLQYQNYSSTKCESMFTSLLYNTFNTSKTNNIMIFTPWCDQGLGIQSKNYYHILKDNNVNVFIFSVKPYNANSAIELQRNPEEWIADNIYYSSNDREKVTDAELLEFIFKYNIGKCIIPETCWFRIFEITKLLENNGVKCYAVPNIEIVRKDEIVKHKYFTKILCNNYICKDIFTTHGINNTVYVGYGIYDNNLIIKPKIITDPIKFLFIGGMNAFSRKHILLICEAFLNAYKLNNNIHLTCTIQKINQLEVEDSNKIKEYLSCPGITFIQEHLKYTDIIDLYYNNHISIQVSKHEGLGIGFYEAVSTGTPVITLNTAPHNEIIKDGINGWIIPCYYKNMKDNTDSFLQSSYFDPIDLQMKILEIVNDKIQILKLIDTLILDFNNRLTNKIFTKNFINELL